MPKGHFNNLTIRLTTDDETEVGADIISRSRFMQLAASFNYLIIVGDAAAGLSKDESLGSLWSDLEPDDGGFSFEIATSLPYQLPSFDSSPEYTLRVGLSELVVSSRMVRCFCTVAGSDHEPLRYYLVHRLGVPALIESRALTNTHPLPIATFISKTFRCRATTAEQAVRDGFHKWSVSFRADISRLLEVLRADCEDTRHLMPHIGSPSFPIYWLMATGAKGRSGVAQFVTDMTRYSPRPYPNLEPAAAARVRSRLAHGTPTAVHRNALSLARTFANYQFLDLTLVQVCVACEAVLGHMYLQFLQSRGVSKNRYEDYQRDINLSQLLNFHLFAACDLTQWHERDESLGLLNWARKQRNTAVHGGHAQLEPERVKATVGAAEALIGVVLDQWPLDET